MKKNQLYWMLQIGGWGGLHITSFLAIAFILPLSASLMATFASVLSAVFISHLYRLYVKRQKWKDLKVVKLIPRVFFSSILLGSILAVSTFLASVGSFVLIAKLEPSLLDSFTPMSKLEGIDDATLEKLREVNRGIFSPGTLALMAISFIGSYAVYFISWSAIYFAYQFLQKNREVGIEKWKLQATIKDAELSALKSQINPHFIFNSLNNIRSLVVEDAEKARDSITHLSDLLRFSIQFDHYEKVSLEKEIEVVEHYLNLESIQLENRLSYRFLIDPTTKDYSVPPMIIQTLVENAIKHSINNLAEGGEIIVESKKTYEFLSIFVKNTGQLKGPNGTKRKGIGIGNAKERLRLLYGENANLSVENMSETMVCATVRIPLN